MGSSRSARCCRSLRRPTTIMSPGVNKHRSGTPSPGKLNALILHRKLHSRRGPNRRRQGPRLLINFRRYFNYLFHPWIGSRFGAYSQPDFDPQIRSLGSTIENIEVRSRKEVLLCGFARPFGRHSIGPFPAPRGNACKFSADQPAPKGHQPRKALPLYSGWALRLEASATRRQQPR